MKYKCTKSLLIPGFDDDGFATEKDFAIEAGDEFNHKGAGFILGADHHLSNDRHWLEISNESLLEYFEPVAEKDGENNEQS